MDIFKLVLQLFYSAQAGCSNYMGKVPPGNMGSRQHNDESLIHHPGSIIANPGKTRQNFIPTNRDHIITKSNIFTTFILKYVADMTDLSFTSL